MVELLRSNDVVLLSFAEAILTQAGFSPFISDTNMSILDGSIAAIPRRLLVAEEEAAEAKATLDEALKAAEEQARNAPEE
ncbi:hypothetical protein sos41_33300 [Alphaproteobacteria bacterium SO-S41]|nr:hypothetical protein sos41_33300 [Alphaproteobacteria bacterium SO-S41]